MISLRRVGFDRKVRLEWLDAIAGKMENERDDKELRECLHDLLKKEYPTYEARRKTVTVLMRIWFFITPENVNMRDKALQVIGGAREHERLLIHWGMTLLAYPFFRDVVTTIGRLCILQGDFSVSQIAREMEKSWGQRTTARRAIRRVISSLYEWGVIDQTGCSGVYMPSAKVEGFATDFELWFIEAVLKSGEADFIPLDQLHNIPCAFPFSISLSISDLFESDNLGVSQQGVNRGIITSK